MDNTLKDRQQVFVGHQNKVYISEDAESYERINGLVSTDESNNSNVEKFATFEDEGFMRSLKTTNEIEFSIEAKFLAEDKGQLMIQETTFHTGEDAIRYVKIVTPTKTVQFRAAIVVNKSGMGSDSTGVLPLEATFHMDGKPDVKDGGYATEVRLFED